MTKHTPGPWSVYDSGEHGATYGIDGHHGEAVVWYGEDSFSGIRKLANARLIAAAPELYEAIKLIRGIIMDAAPEGFNPHVGDWADRLFESQGVTARLMRKVEGDEWTCD